MRTVALLAAACVATQVRADRPCPPDIDCSGAVDVQDLVTVITEWGTTGSPADADGSGVVDVGDLVEVITTWGPCLFAFDPPRENAEAEQIAFEMLGADGPLLVDDAQYERVDRDLELIRAAWPELAGQTHSPAWAASELLVQVQQGVPRDGYDCLKVYYHAEEDFLFDVGGFDWYVLTHAGAVNVAALAGVYMTAPEVGVAEPNGIIGGQNFWSATPLGEGVWRWDVDDGWHDCFDGCDCHRVYVIETDAEGNVEVISVQEFGAPWCEF